MKLRLLPMLLICIGVLLAGAYMLNTMPRFVFLDYAVLALGILGTVFTGISFAVDNTP